VGGIESVCVVYLMLMLAVAFRTKQWDTFWNS